MFLLFFLINDPSVLISAVIAQFYIPTAEQVMSIGIPTNKAKTETQTHPVTAEAKLSNCSI